MRYTAGMAYLTKPGNLQYVDAGTFPAINDVYSYTPYKKDTLWQRSQRK